ncbi:MAG: class I SAM-dependent methyltransferase, partial [Akkermansiaceae bacterium]|nr:class I SAM-dependent methyltransferase [Akkermansiaceae bacterium]
MNFDRLAPCYRALEFLAAGNQLQRCRTAFLDSIPAPRRVLIAGEGNGRFLGEIARRFPYAAITVVDSSRTMLDLAKSRVSKSGAAASRIEFVHADLRDWTPAESGNFDLIVTHFFLDCFPPDRLAKVVARLSELAAPTATWLLADFQS